MFSPFSIDWTDSFKKPFKIPYEILIGKARQGPLFFRARDWKKVPEPGIRPGHWDRDRSKSWSYLSYNSINYFDKWIAHILVLGHYNVPWSSCIYICPWSISAINFIYGWNWSVQVKLKFICLRLWLLVRVLVYRVMAISDSSDLWLWFGLV